MLGTCRSIPGADLGCLAPVAPTLRRWRRDSRSIASESKPTPTRVGVGQSLRDFAMSVAEQLLLHRPGGQWKLSGLKSCFGSHSIVGCGASDSHALGASGRATQFTDSFSNCRSPKIRDDASRCQKGAVCNKRVIENGVHSEYACKHETKLSSDSFTAKKSITWPKRKAIRQRISLHPPLRLAFRTQCPRSKLRCRWECRDNCPATRWPAIPCLR